MIASHPGDEHIHQTIVIVISASHSHSIKAHIQTRTGSHIGEMAGAVIVIQSHRGKLGARWNFPGPIGGVDKEQVLMSIVVEIKKSDPAAHGFGQEFLTVSAVIMHKTNPSGRRDIRELSFWNRERCG